MTSINTATRLRKTWRRKWKGRCAAPTSLCSTWVHAIGCSSLGWTSFWHIRHSLQVAGACRPEDARPKSKEPLGLLASCAHDSLLFPCRKKILHQKKDKFKYRFLLEILAFSQRGPPTTRLMKGWFFPCTPSVNLLPPQPPASPHPSFQRKRALHVKTFQDTKLGQKARTLGY